MSDANTPVKNDQTAAKLNQILSVVVGGLVLGVLGMIAYQNRSSVVLPDRNKLWGDFLTKRIAANKAAFPEFKPAFDANTKKWWEDPQAMQGNGFQGDWNLGGGPGQSSISFDRNGALRGNRSDR